MNTVIKINGLDVEFSEKAPTRAGVYWWQCAPKLQVWIKEVASDPAGELWDKQSFRYISKIGGLWSTSPLVPAVEIRHAWMEARELNPDEPEYARWDWDESRAKRVTEGGE